MLQLHAALVRKRIRVLSRDPRPIAFTASWGGTAVVHPDTYPGRAGRWRATWLDREGEPAGHADCQDFVSALTRAKEEGAHLFYEVPTSVKAGG